MFLRNIMRAIARLLGITTRHSVSPAQPTPTAGPVNQEPTTRAGSKRSAAPTKRKPVAPKAKRKPSAAQPTTPVKSRKPKQKPAQPAVKASGATGSQPATRASKTRQHAK